jgi:hypothetical protein
MLRPVRGLSAPPHGVRFLSLLVSFAGALFVATCASAQSPASAGSDSVASAPVRPPASPSPASTVPAPAAPKPKAYRFHMHGGLFAPIDANAPSPTLGLRFGRRLASHVHAGLLAGWTFQRKNLEEPVNGLPGLQPKRILARVDGQLVPLMLYFQVDLNETRFLVPYAGIAAGYEWFNLKANDYRTGETASATYSNYAWESWGGVGMRLGRDMSVDFELSYNGGSLERDVTDTSGQSWTEAVNANGVGARVGLHFLF